MDSRNDSGVRYLVVSGDAVPAHGHPRYTKDLDVWLERSPENAARVVKALEPFGFGSLGLTEADFPVPDLVTQLGHPPSRTDLVSTPDGVDFVTCCPARVQVDLNGVVVRTLFVL